MRSKQPSNAEIADCLREIALYLEMQDVPFKPRAYEKAAYAIEALDEPVGEIHARDGLKGLQKIAGVGKGIATRLEELLRKGHIAELDECRKQVPVNVRELTRIDGLGPKKVKLLWDALRIRDVDDLERAAREQRVRRLAHFGKQTEARILRGIELHRQAGGRRLLGSVLPIARSIEERLRRAPGVLESAVAGSLRRRRDTIGDADFLAAARDPAPVMDFFASMPEVQHVYARGPTKTLVRLSNGMDADLRVVAPESWGAALAYFTGSKDHNIALRRRAMEHGWKLSEYGLFAANGSVVAGRTEEEVYRALGLPWVPPELRENRGEIEAALAGRLPEPIGFGDLRGDLQIQTNWTDGHDSIEQVARAAKRLGREYIAITDHTRDLAMARGCDEAKLARQAVAIRDAERKVGIRILTGAEVNIRRDGSLDVDDEALARLDFVGAAIHGWFELPRREMTRRIIRAIENPHVDAVFHPLTRKIGQRRAIDVDYDAVLAAARRTGTALEVNAQPDRLDLDEHHVRKALAAGVKLVIDSDAHTIPELSFPEEYGIAQARRGWARRQDVLNTLPVRELLASLKGGPRANAAALEDAQP